MANLCPVIGVNDTSTVAMLDSSSGVDFVPHNLGTTGTMGSNSSSLRSCSRPKEQWRGKGSGILESYIESQTHGP